MTEERDYKQQMNADDTRMHSVKKTENENKRRNIETPRPQLYYWRGKVQRTETQDNSETCTPQ
jgi:hypothetical protein